MPRGSIRSIPATFSTPGCPRVSAVRPRRPRHEATVLGILVHRRRIGRSQCLVETAADAESYAKTVPCCAQVRSLIHPCKFPVLIQDEDGSGAWRLVLDAGFGGGGWIFGRRKHGFSLYISLLAGIGSKRKVRRRLCPPSDSPARFSPAGVQSQVHAMFPALGATWGTFAPESQPLISPPNGVSCPPFSL